MILINKSIPYIICVIENNILSIYGDGYERKKNNVLIPRTCLMHNESMAIAVAKELLTLTDKINGGETDW